MIPVSLQEEVDGEQLFVALREAARRTFGDSVHSKTKEGYCPGSVTRLFVDGSVKIGCALPVTIRVKRWLRRGTREVTSQNSFRVITLCRSFRRGQMYGDLKLRVDVLHRWVAFGPYISMELSEWREANIFNEEYRAVRGKIEEMIARLYELLGQGTKVVAA